MKTLLLLFAGPLQAWGVRSSSPRHRDTGMFPSRSGIVGMLSACLGLDRTVDPSWSDQLGIAVRIDQPGAIEQDFHTVGGGYLGDRRMITGTGKRREHALVTSRDYLADAAFVVAITGGADTIDRLAGAVERPRYTPFLGRKSCPPGPPLLIGTTTGDGLKALESVPAYGGMVRSSGQGEATFASILASSQPREDTELVERLVIVENPQHAVTTINDAPASFDHWHRSHNPRAVGEETVRIPRAGEVGGRAVVEMRRALIEETS